MRKTIFVVDDSDTNLAMAENVLEEEYRVMTLPTAGKMFSLLEKVIPDLILMDIEMPEMDGFEALRRLQAHSLYADIPVIFLTAFTDAAIEARGFELGAVDFISKPPSPSVLKNRVKTHLHIDQMIRERTAQLKQLQNAIVDVFADIVENRDRETGGHVERTVKYIKALMDAMIERDVYADEIRSWDLELVASSARLHDVGKITISDTILNKPGPLTEEEFAIMKTHSLEGMRIIDQIIERTGEVEFLEHAKLFAGYHHEYWNGKGYPYGKKETEIPLQGRIMAVVDVYDALVSERPYKKAFTNKEAIDIIMYEAGLHFDQKIVDVFVEIQDRIR